MHMQLPHFMPPLYGNLRKEGQPALVGKTGALHP